MASRVRAPLSDLAEGIRILDAEASRYLVRVLRLTVGDTFVAFDPVVAREADAWLEQVDDHVIVVAVGPMRPSPVIAASALTLVQGLAKGDKTDAIVRDATELGATEIVIAITARSVVRLDAERLHARRERWEKIAQEAARQSGRGDAPRIDVCSWQEAMEVARPGTARFCLWERADAPLAPLLFPALETKSPLAFAAGPEGGLEEAEVLLATNAGWSAASLGSIILRTETIAAAVLGAVRVWQAR
jgi:16S rRNA (uracil1498-N3)-methyltransferase